MEYLELRIFNLYLVTVIIVKKNVIEENYQ